MADRKQSPPSESRNATTTTDGVGGEAEALLALRLAVLESVEDEGDPLVRALPLPGNGL